MLAEMLLATSKNMEETQNELETKSLQKLNLSNKDGFNCFIKLFRDWSRSFLMYLCVELSNFSQQL